MIRVTFLRFLRVRGYFFITKLYDTKGINLCLEFKTKVSWIIWKNLCIFLLSIFSSFFILVYQYYGREFQSGFQWPPIQESTSLCNPLLERQRERQCECVFLCVCVCTQTFSWVWLFESPWTVAHQAPLSTGLPRQEYWSGLPISFSRWPSQPRDWTRVTCVSRTGRRILSR